MPVTISCLTLCCSQCCLWGTGGVSNHYPSMNFSVIISRKAQCLTKIETLCVYFILKLIWHILLVPTQFVACSIGCRIKKTAGKPATTDTVQPCKSNESSSWDYGTYHIGDQQRLRRACASSPEPLLFAHMKYGSRWRVWPKIRHLAPPDGCACVFEEWVYGRRKIP